MKKRIQKAFNQHAITTKGIDCNLCDFHAGWKACEEYYKKRFTMIRIEPVQKFERIDLIDNSAVKNPYEIL